MSQEHTEIVRQVYDAWNRDDLQWALDHIAPEFEMRPNAGFADLDQVYRGHKGLEAWYAQWRDAWQTLNYRIERVEDLGDRVLVLVLVRGQGRDSGVEVQDRRGHLFDFEEGLCIRFQSFAKWAEALEAVGLSESS